MQTLKEIADNHIKRETLSREEIFGFVNGAEFGAAWQKEQYVEQLPPNVLSIRRRGDETNIDHYCPANPYRVGERVKVYDGSYNLEVSITLKNRHGIDPLFNESAEIIRINEPIVLPFIVGESCYFTRLDLMLQFSNGIKIWCSSICVRRVDPSKTDK